MVSPNKNVTVSAFLFSPTEALHIIARLGFPPAGSSGWFPELLPKWRDVSQRVLISCLPGGISHSEVFLASAGGVWNVLLGPEVTGAAKAVMQEFLSTWKVCWSKVPLLGATILQCSCEPGHLWSTLPLGGDPTWMGKV